MSHIGLLTSGGTSFCHIDVASVTERPSGIVEDATRRRLRLLLLLERLWSLLHGCWQMSVTIIIVIAVRFAFAKETSSTTAVATILLDPEAFSTHTGTTAATTTRTTHATQAQVGNDKRTDSTDGDPERIACRTRPRTSDQGLVDRDNQCHGDNPGRQRKEQIDECIGRQADARSQFTAYGHAAKG